MRNAAVPLGLFVHESNRKVTMTPVIRNTVFTICLGIVAGSLSGATGNSPTGFTARTGSLDPVPIQAHQPAALVEETVVMSQTPLTATSAAAVISGGLAGSIGYASAFGNCVDEPGVKNPGFGNPINWPIGTEAPYIGATALFDFNHVGVVTGIWSNGDLEIRHRNWHGGNQHRFPRSMFRGFI